MPTPIQINSGQFAQQYANATQGPFVSGTNLFSLISTNTTLEIVKSTDGGVTWNVQDPTHQPGATNGGACWFDPINGLIWVASADNSAIAVNIFKISTGLWNTNTFDGPPVSVVRACVLRTDQTLLIASEGGTSVSGLQYDIFDTPSLSYTVTGDLGAGILSNPDYSSFVFAGNPVVSGDNGPTSRASVVWIGFMTTDNAPGSPMQGGVFFQSFSIANDVTSFFAVPGQTGNPQPATQALRCGNGPFMGPPAVCSANNIVFGVAKTSAADGNFASLYVTTDAGTTWNLDTTLRGIDPGIAIPTTFDNAQFAPMSFFDGVNLTMVYSRILGFVFPATVVRLCTTVPNFANPPSTWIFTAVDLFILSQFAGAVPGTDGLNFSKQTTQPPVTLSSVELFTGNNSSLTSWMFPVSFPNPPSPPTGIIDPNGIPVHHLPFCHREECIFS